MVIVHRGPKSTVCISSEGWWRTFDVPEVDRVVNKTGGGDAFAAGYLAAIMQKLSLDEAVTRAHALATDVVQRPGVEFPIERTGR